MRALARKAYRRMRPAPPVAAWEEPVEPLEPEFDAVRQLAEPFTMTGRERMYALWQGIRYIHRSGIEGDIVECGVWRGGSSLVAALALDQVGDKRGMWLYDTFEGMAPPTDQDVDYSGRPAEQILAEIPRDPGADNVWAYATLEDVRQNMGLADSRAIEYVAGKVEDTIPARTPDKIALLRLDTDWYESTRHELEQLYPLLARGGVLIIDDYGHWQGAKRAVDEFFDGRPELLNRIDYSGRLAIKTHD